MPDSEDTESRSPGDDASEALQEKPSDERIAEIEEERQRRLDPDNRPENTEIDNSDAELPTVRAFAEMNDDGGEGVAGSSDPSETFRENPPSEEEVKEIEEERKRRLDPANRPENTEVDNTGKPPPADPV